MKDQVRYDRTCRICRGTDIQIVMRLADTPMEDQYLKEPVPQPTFPLVLAICESCGYLHLPYVVSPETSYENYVYVSGVTVGLRSHYDTYASEIVERYAIPQGSLVVDLGSNDGSMLNSFKKLSMQVVGVEPARNIATEANNSGIPTLNDFFTRSSCDRILKDHGSARVITANYMYANVDDVLEFTSNVERLLSEDGVFVIQTGYHPEQFRIKMFDYVYHEHFSYFSARVLKRVVEECGLRLIHVEKTKPKGGSLRATIQRAAGPRTVDASVPRLLEEEEQREVHVPGTYLKFADVINQAGSRLREQLTSWQVAGKRIVGLGASHSTTTLMYHFRLHEFVDYLVDDNDLKHGTFSPGKHVPVHPTSKLYGDRPDVALVLAWQHAESILDRHARFLKQGGTFCVPLPELNILTG